ncbi:Phosphatidylinositol 4-kinase gamma 2 [Hibiscus syriacus]|uniref:1-phosphatidylinositol 4-kinase n=1 Tax=Hibiscus syriacus TaxID=106335 RepID=A0A6A2YAS1_HIBSY|nr:Phosphatidylinositol 4-kinase gamma 2 [Hibiscus syriacus]
MPMRVLESESIASVKLRSRQAKGCGEEPEAVCGGRELTRNDSLLKDYGIKGGNVLHLVLKLSDLLLVTVRTSCGKELELRVNRNRNIGYLERRIARKGKVLVAVDEQEIFFNGEKIDDQRLIDDLCKYNDVMIHLVVQKSAKVHAKHVEKDLELSVVAESELDESSSSVEGEENQSMSIRLDGRDFMQDKSRLDCVSIFKPIDEEPMALNNPRGLPPSMNGEGLKRGIRVGEGAVQEVAAYISDHHKMGPRSSSGDELMGFAGVPPTCMVQCLHKGFSHPDGFESAPENVKVFDIRMANADRHAGNILFRKGEDCRIVLIPIDHCYCLPENLRMANADCTFEWIYWPQSRKPYFVDTINYIKSIDAGGDIELLKYYGWDGPIECANTLRISTMLLNKGAERGLTPFTIGSIMCRETVNKESMIKQIVREARGSLLPGMSETTFMESISQVMESRLDKLKN